MDAAALFIACQGCVSAKPCPRCATPVPQGAKIPFLDLWADQPAPKADRRAPRFAFCRVQPRRFSELQHGPPPKPVCGPGGETLLQIQVDIALLVPASHKTKAMRALHRMAFVGTVPLLAKIPSPWIEPLAGRNVPATPALIVGTRRCALPCGPRTDLLCPQAQLHAAACDRMERRANQSKPVQPFARKYSAFSSTQISRITPLVSRG